jgi:aryl-alcohol dehydrogenase-like predicted oxidoreductase
MNLTRTAYGTWSGGRFMHYGEQLSEEHYMQMMRLSFEKGVRTFVTADVYGAGRADALLGEALKGIPREEYCLVGIVGHDFYEGLRAGSRGYPRFTDPALRGPEGYQSYLEMATEKSLERCQTSKFDLLMLHNPDSIAYTQDSVWNAFTSLKDKGLTDRLGIAPGPANGFTLDMIECFERFGDRMDWAMIILNPFEPWPGQHVLGAAAKNNVDILARVVDYGGLFHDDVRPGHIFRDGDHRTHRPAGWIEHGYEKIEKVRPIAEKHGLTMLQLACQWTLANTAVKSVVPTLIQEAGEGARTIESKLEELAALPEQCLTAEEVETIRTIGDNTGCMMLKGASHRHEGQEPRPDEWPMRDDLLTLATRWGLGTSW